MEISPRIKANLDNYFISISNKEFFGLVSIKDKNKIDLEKIINKGKCIGLKFGWKSRDYFIKKLDSSELTEIPPQRFSNSVSTLDRSIERSDICYFPKAVGLIYEGSWPNLLNKSVKNSYFISEFIDGPTLIKSLNRLKKSFEKIFIYLKEELDRFSKIGIYPLDFAPRDIVMYKNIIPVIVDTEHVEISGKSIDKKNTKKQINQFREDYSYFLRKKELKLVEDILFKERLKEIEEYNI